MNLAVMVHQSGTYLLITLMFEISYLPITLLCVENYRINETGGLYPYHVGAIETMRSKTRSHPAMVKNLGRSDSHIWMESKLIIIRCHPVLALLCLICALHVVNLVD